MATLSISSDGDVKLSPELSRHLGVQPGDAIEVELLPNGRAALHAATPVSSPEAIREAWDRLANVLSGKTAKVATLEEIEKAAQDGWAGLG